MISVQIAVCHLTRMKHPYVCVAGLDLATHQHVRLISPSLGRIPGRLCTVPNSPFRIGACIDIGDAKPCGCAPEVEDCYCDTGRVRLIQQLKKPEFWQLLLSVARPHLSDIFGRELVKTGNTFAIEQGRGCASLGCFHPIGTPTVEVRQYESESRIYLHLTDFNDHGTVAVTDWRLHEDADGWPINQAMTTKLRDCLNATNDVILSVGLTRPWQGKHWLQVNNVHVIRRTNHS